VGTLHLVALTWACLGLSACIGNSTPLVKEVGNLAEIEVSYIEKGHATCVKVLDNFVRQAGLQVIDTKYYQRGADEFAVSVLLAEQIDGDTAYSGASCVREGGGEPMLMVRGPTLEKVSFDQLRRW